MPGANFGPRLDLLSTVRVVRGRLNEVSKITKLGAHACKTLVREKLPTLARNMSDCAIFHALTKNLLLMFRRTSATSPAAAKASDPA